MLKKFIQALIMEVEKKNSWGKNELKELIYRLSIDFIDERR